MGQNQSSAQSGAELSENSIKRKDYYDLLEVEREASPEEFVTTLIQSASAAVYYS